MVGSPEQRREAPWLSASDLSEYTFCPRAYYYRHHPPASGPTLASEREARLGERRHQRALNSVRHRETRAWVWLGLLAFSLLGVTIVVAGWLLGWI